MLYRARDGCSHTDHANAIGRAYSSFASISWLTAAGEKGAGALQRDQDTGQYAVMVSICITSRRPPWEVSDWKVGTTRLRTSMRIPTAFPRSGSDRGVYVVARRVVDGLRKTHDGMSVGLTPVEDYQGTGHPEAEGTNGNSTVLPGRKGTAKARRIGTKRAVDGSRRTHDGMNVGLTPAEVYLGTGHPEGTNNSVVLPIRSERSPQTIKIVRGNCVACRSER